MMKKLFLIPLLLLLSSCEPAKKTGSDGYMFGEKQYTQTPVTVEVVVYPNRVAFERELKRLKLSSNDGRIIAFTSLYPLDKTRCTMHMVDPAVEYVPEFVGHEFLHCVYGQWHTNNQQRK